MEIHDGLRRDLGKIFLNEWEKSQSRDSGSVRAGGVPPPVAYSDRKDGRGPPPGLSGFPRLQEVVNNNPYNSQFSGRAEGRHLSAAVDRRYTKLEQR